MESNKFKILIADDEPDLVEVLSYNLKKEGYEVIAAYDGDQAIDQAQKHQPDLIILDMMMPKKTGVQVCNILRNQNDFSKTLIMFLTALNDDTTQIRGLETGADDYVSKPVSTKVLLSRVAALLRRHHKHESGAVIKINNLTIDPIKFHVLIDEQEIILAKKEFELLYLLALKPGRVFLRNEILNAIWGNEVIVGDRTIDVHIRKIRQKLNLDCITTVKGVGYKFEL